MYPISLAQNQFTKIYSTMHTNGIGAPEHLNAGFFEDVLENGLCEANISMTDISLTLGSSAGENYCSQIYRVKCIFKRTKNGETEKASVIVKSIPLDENSDFLEVLEVYHKEKVFYMDVLPKMEILLDNFKFAPKCYYAKKKPIYTIAFEDMNSAGYTMASRQAGLDEHHTKLALIKLAQFHAVSMVYARKEPEMMTKFSAGFLNPKAMTPSCVLYKLFYKYLAHLIKVVSQWEGYEEITKKLQIFHENFENRLSACQAPRKDGLKVLNHGDFWVNNMLFKYEGDIPKDLVFLDFQMSLFASPGIDLNYFLHASAQLEVLKQAEVMLETYHESLKETLKKLHYDNIPTYEDILYEYKRSSSFGLFTMFGPLPVMSMDKSQCGDNSFETLAESDEKMISTFSSKRLLEQLKHSLKLINEFGGLDPNVDE